MPFHFPFTTTAYANEMQICIYHLPPPLPVIMIMDSDSADDGEVKIMKTISLSFPGKTIPRKAKG